MERGSTYHAGVLGCGTKHCSSASEAHEYYKKQFPTTAPAKAAASMLRAMARCTIGCDMAEPYTEGKDVGNVKTEWFRGEDLIDMSTNMSGP